MRSRRIRLAELLTATVILSTAACGSATTGDTDATPAPVALSETGSTLLYPLFSEWGAAYQQKYPHVTVTTQDGGSGAGIAQVAAGAVDIGASDAYLSEGDRAAHPGLMNIALAISAQQINYNLPGLTDPIKLDGKVLAAMYSGTVKAWNDPQIAALNPGLNLPDTPVVPLHRSDGSGDTFLFTQYLSKQDPDGWGKTPGFGTTVDFPAVPEALGENSNGAMVTGCAANPGCVAYVSASQSEEARDRQLGTAQLANAAGNYRQPDAKSIQAAAAGFADQTPDNQAVSLINAPDPDAYPIVNYEYAIVDSRPKSDRDNATAQTLQAFLHWAITDGNAPSFLDKVHFQPLPDAVAKQSQAQIAKISAE
jgi:phosphate transport system substrate-binding protein